MHMKEIIDLDSIADEDEEGDRITVRGDEELQAMISGVIWTLSIFFLIFCLINLKESI